MPPYRRIILPTRPQVDTIAAIFLLKRFGKEKFPGIENADIEILSVWPEGATEASFDREGAVVIDIGKGRFDHHASERKTTATNLVAEFLGVKELPALAKILQFAERDDFYGKGIVSADPLDRAFGLPGLLANLNRSHKDDPGFIIKTVLPLFQAHYEEESRRTEELPKELEEKTAKGEVAIFNVKQRDKTLKAIIIFSDNVGMPGYLRSQIGGRFDVVAQQLSSGHMNILTRPTKQVDLRSLVALLRVEEASRRGYELEGSAADLAVGGRLPQVPEWYFDPATNSIQNGGVNPQGVSPTAINGAAWKKILDLGLSERAWKPASHKEPGVLPAI